MATVRSSSAMRDRAATGEREQLRARLDRAQLGGRRRGLGGEHDEQHADRLLAVAQRRRYALPRRARLGERRRRGVEPLRAGGVASRRDGRGGVGRRQPFGEPPRHPGRRAEAQRAVLEQVDARRIRRPAPARRVGRPPAAPWPGRARGSAPRRGRRRRRVPQPGRAGGPPRRGPRRRRPPAPRPPPATPRPRAGSGAARRAGSGGARRACAPTRAGPPPPRRAGSCG